MNNLIFIFVLSLIFESQSKYNTEYQKSWVIKFLYNNL